MAPAAFPLTGDNHKTHAESRPEMRCPGGNDRYLPDTL